MDILLIDNQTKHLDSLIALLPETPTVIAWNKLSVNDALRRDLIILSGGTNLPTIAEYEEFFLLQKSILLGTNVPVIGICFGAEVIAKTYSATLRKLNEKRQGIITIHPTEQGKNILNIRSPFNVYEGHSWAIKTLPEDFDILATSEDGIELFKHTKRPVFGIQFHPEHLPEQTSGDEIFKVILSHICH